MGVLSDAVITILEILLETDDKVGSLLVPVEVSGVCSEACTTRENSVAEAA